MRQKVIKRSDIQRPAALLVLALLVLTACRRVPGDVIQPDEMSALLADMHIGDAVVELNRNRYPDDSTRMLLKQSILSRHGVDNARFDSSLVWYAHNPEKYLEVYDNTIALLQERMDRNNAEIAGSLSVAGDSVDLWTGSRYVVADDRSATRYITFNIEADANTAQGDRYTWRGKFINNIPQAQWGISATYADGTVEVLDTRADREGWNEIEFVSDSTLRPVQVYGYIRLEPRPGVATWVDSIQLVRNRAGAEAYRHRYRLRTYRR